MTKNKYTDKELAEIARSGEPYFLLRARDLYAPETIDEWIKLVTILNLSEEQVKMIQSAQQVANDMRNWQRENKFQFPD